jgi:SNF2 family DNA or RNA helicase
LLLFDLWEHQQKLVDWTLPLMRERGYAFWAVGCATGKTRASIAVACELGVKRLLVLTTQPAITSAWVKEFEKLELGWKVTPLLKGTSATKAKALQERHPLEVVIVNYETAALITPSLKGFDMVIADESHRLKTHNSKQSKALAKIVSPFKLAMTGTPFSDRPTDLYGQIRFLNGNVYGSWNAFFERYVRYRLQEGYIKIPVGYKNTDELIGRIAPFTYFMSTDDVMTLPPRHTIVVECNYDDDKDYKTFARDAVLELGTGEYLTADGVLALTLRLQQYTGGHGVVNGEPINVPSPKLTALVDIVEQIGKHPVVVFCRFKEEANAIERALPHKKCLRLTGAVKQHNEFQAGEGDVLIANIQAGAAGINLTRARFCVYYSTGYSRTSFEQSLDRVRRDGSDLNYPITYYHILVKDTIDTDIFDVLHSKGDTVEELKHAVQRSLLVPVH